MIEIIKNPVIIGLTAGILVYIYMRWEQSRRDPRERIKRKDTNLLIPLGVGIACWFVSHNYYENYNFNGGGGNISEDKLDFTQNIPSKIEDTMAGGANLTNNVGQNLTQNMQNLQSYHVLKRGVTIPENINMPDVLLENF